MTKLQSETPSDRPLDVGTHRKPRTLPSFWACPPRRANSSADRAIAMICGSVLRKAGTSISSKTRRPLSIHSASVRAPASNERLAASWHAASPSSPRVPVQGNTPGRFVPTPLRVRHSTHVRKSARAGRRERQSASPTAPVHDRSRSVAPDGPVRSIGRPRRPARSASSMREPETAWNRGDERLTAASGTRRCRLHPVA